MQRTESFLCSGVDDATAGPSDVTYSTIDQKSTSENVKRKKEKSKVPILNFTKYTNIYIRNNKCNKQMPGFILYNSMTAGGGGQPEPEIFYSELKAVKTAGKIRDILISLSSPNSFAYVN